MPEQEQDVSCQGAATRGWAAWANMMPLNPGKFHVTGEVEVGNPGLTAELRPTEPQGINPEILLLDLHLTQSLGEWPQVMTWVQARYDEAGYLGGYTEVNIFCEGAMLARLPVEIVS